LFSFVPFVSFCSKFFSFMAFCFQTRPTACTGSKRKGLEQKETKGTKSKNEAWVLSIHN
jgi:hypothetical protein